jgi:serine/threonine-protein kinase HipA
MTNGLATAGGTREIRTLEVRLAGTLAGTLTHLGNESCIFTFDRAYLEEPQRPTLSLGFKSADGGLVEPARPTRVRLPPFFSNLLPEGHLREYLARRAGVNPVREFFLLRALGADLPGAIEIREFESTGAGPGEEDAGTWREAGGPLRFSLAGVQLKFSAVAEGARGLTIPVTGVGGDWIVKLPSSRFAAVPEHEYAMMTLAASVGLDVPEVRLIATGDIEGLPPGLPEAFGQSLAVRRFDRAPGGARVHIEDFAQVFSLYPDDKYRRASYGNLARVLWIETGEAGVTEFIRRLVFHVLIGNADAHVKNWSLIYPDGRTPRLAPAYDLVGTVGYIPGDRLALSIDGVTDFRRVDLALIERFAERAGLPVRLVVRAARETTAAVRDLWPSHEPLRALPAPVRSALDAHLVAVPL